MGDAVQLQQFLVNLVTNADEAMSGITGRPRVVTIRSGMDRSSIDQPSIDQPSIKSAGAVLVTVEDTGAGLDPQDIDRIFDRFYTPKPEGIGVGVCISRSNLRPRRGQLS